MILNMNRSIILKMTQPFCQHRLHKKTHTGHEQKSETNSNPSQTVSDFAQVMRKIFFQKKTISQKTKQKTIRYHKVPKGT